MIKEKKVVRTDRINTLIFEIARQSGSLAQKKTGKTEFEIDFSRLVELRGVEPRSKQGNPMPSTCLFCY